LKRSRKDDLIRIFGSEKEGVLQSGDECLFCRVIKGEKESVVVYEDDLSFVFLDHRPLFPGHCLLVPKRHFETLPDLPVELLEPLFKRVQLISLAVQKGMNAQGIFIGINNRVSQSVPHLHIHIVPRNRGDGLKGFFWPRHPYGSNEEVLAVRDAIRKAIDEIVSRD